MRLRLLVVLFALPVYASDVACTAKHCELQIDWSQLPAENTYTVRSDANARVTDATSFALHVTNFNFLRYGIEVAVHERTIESYAHLNKLWQSVLLLGTAPTPSFIRADTFMTALMEWREALRDANRNIDEDLGRYPNVSLNAEDLKKVDTDAATLRTEIATLEKKRAAVLAALRASTDVDRIPYFDAADRDHSAVVERIDAFINTTDLLHTGWTKTIDRRDAGRVVTVTLTPKNKITGADGKPVTVEYFVNSSSPLYFHVGAAYNAVRDVQFEQVRTIAGNDLFEKVRDSSGTASLVAFLSYPFGRRLSSNWIPAITLGTDFAKPGDHLYVGVSMPYQRFVASVGVISASQNEPGNAIVEQLANSTNTRVLYDAFRSRHVWKPTIAITVKPFDR